MRDDSPVQVADGVHLVHGSDTNWVVVSDGDAVTLVDTGYPGDHERLLASLAVLGHAPGDVTAVLVTHAHNDHIGSAAYFGSLHGVPVLMHDAEVPHARREFLHQVTVGQVLAQGWRPGVLPWALRALRSGGKRDVRVPQALPFPAPGPLDLPGRPVPVPCAGHTPGHTAYHLPDAGVLITGDALVTGHPTASGRGPQLLHPMFDTDRAQAVAALDVLGGIDADVLLPGHGPAHHGPARDAARRARELAP
ncbi:MBL fold metallo-hydrolase [Streptomyces sp. NPDC002004]